MSSSAIGRANDRDELYEQRSIYARIYLQGRVLESDKGVSLVSGRTMEVEIAAAYTCVYACLTAPEIFDSMFDSSYRQQVQHNNTKQDSEGTT